MPAAKIIHGDCKAFAYRAPQLPYRPLQNPHPCRVCDICDFSYLGDVCPWCGAPAGYSSINNASEGPVPSKNFDLNRDRLQQARQQVLELAPALDRRAAWEDQQPAATKPTTANQKR